MYLLHPTQLQGPGRWRHVQTSSMAVEKLWKKIEYIMAETNKRLGAVDRPLVGIQSPH